MDSVSKKVLALFYLPPTIYGASLMNQRVIDITNENYSLSTHVLRLNYANDF
jgi:hypothetical protein